MHWYQMLLRIFATPLACLLSLHLVLSPAMVLAADAPPSDTPSNEQNSTNRDQLGAKKKHEGDKHFIAREYREAVASYQAAYDLNSDPRVLYNLGRSLEALGEIVEAIDALERFQKEAPIDLLAEVKGLDEHIVALRAKTSQILLSINVEGAEVHWGDRLLKGTEKQRRYSLVAGTAEISVSKIGYFEKKMTLTLAGGSSKNITIQLLPKSNMGLLHVDTGAVQAELYIDGEKLGDTPFENALAAGSHELTIKASGYRDYTSPIRSVPGKQQDLYIKLEQEPGVLETWWFWTITGVVVAGTVAAVIAATTESSAPSGDFSPGKIPAP